MKQSDVFTGKSELLKHEKFGLYSRWMYEANGLANDIDEFLIQRLPPVMVL